MVTLKARRRASPAGEFGPTVLRRSLVAGSRQGRRKREVHSEVLRSTSFPYQEAWGAHVSIPCITGPPQKIHVAGAKTPSLSTPLSCPEVHPCTIRPPPVTHFPQHRSPRSDIK